MAGAIDKGHPSYDDFNAGVDAKHSPLSAIDKKILRFASRMATNPVEKTHGQILRNFGMYPPEFWTRAQNLQDHPSLSSQQRARLTSLFSQPSYPGPMTGGSDQP
jgi:hypothetical protein